MKTLTLLFALLLTAPHLTAQNNTAHHVGLHAGSTTGLGFSYRYWPTKFGFQVTAIPVLRGGSNNFLSSGLSFLYTFKDNETVDLYGYVGNHLIYVTHEQQYDYNYQTNEYKTKTVGEATYNVGFGLGLKIEVLEVLNLNLQAGYGLYNLTNSANTNIAGEFGIYYNF